ILLQILDDGRLTDGHGRTVDFKNSVIIMTSNVGVELIRRDMTIGFAAQRDEAKTRKRSYDNMKEKVLGEMKKTFRPEFLNRIDEIIVFHELTEDQLRNIVDLLIKDLQGRLADRKLGVELTERAKSWLNRNHQVKVTPSPAIALLPLTGDANPRPVPDPGWNLNLKALTSPETNKATSPPKGFLQGYLNRKIYIKCLILSPDVFSITPLSPRAGSPGTKTPEQVTKQAIQVTFTKMEFGATAFAEVPERCLLSTCPGK
ncbi:unnamed protein product, partial [marine sediment metagenome]